MKKKCLHDIFKKDCRICNAHAYCIHNIIKKFCNFCNSSIKKNCRCKRNIVNCQFCINNIRCYHGKKRARCFNCRRPDDRLCQLSNYQKNQYKNEICDCSLCISSEAIRQGKICFVCKKNETIQMSRCKNCFEIYQKNIVIETKITNFLENKIDYSSIKKPLEIIIKNYQGIHRPRVDYAISKINEIYQYTQKGIQRYELEKKLDELLKIMAHVSNRCHYLIQLNIGAYYLNKIEAILEKCLTNESEYYIVRIIWYILNKNPSVMREILESSNIIKIIKNKISNYRNDSSETVNQILNHFNVYGFNYKTRPYFTTITIYKNTP